MRRLFWALAGVGLGGIVGAQVVRWAAKAKQRYAPPNLARQASGRVASLGDRLRRALEDGAAEMADREAELRADLGLPSQ